MPGPLAPASLAPPLPAPASAPAEPGADFAALLAAVTTPVVEVQPVAEQPAAVDPEVLGALAEPAVVELTPGLAAPVAVPLPLPTVAATPEPPVPSASQPAPAPPTAAGVTLPPAPTPLEPPAPPRPEAAPAPSAPAEGATALPVPEAPVPRQDTLPTPISVGPAPPAPPPATAPLTAGSSVVAGLPAPPPAAQVALALAPVLTGPDGSYSLSIELYPEELGTVSVEVSVRGGAISMSVQATGAEALHALRTALPELTAQLESTGLTATDVSVGERETRHGQGDAQRHTGTRPGDGGSPAPADEPATVSAGSTSFLDVRI